MTKDHIIYSESVETFHAPGLKKWRRAEIGAKLSEGDNPLEGLAELQKDVQAFLRPEEVEISEAMQGILPVEDVSILIQEIVACTEIDKLNNVGVQVGLIAYMGELEKHPELRQYFDKQLAKLQTGKEIKLP